MSKRGQVTVLIILAIVIALIALVLFFTLGNDQSFGGTEFDKESENIKQFTEECMNQIYIDSIEFVSAQGGYSKEPHVPYLSDVGLFMPIYRYNEDVVIPNKEITELDLGLIIDENTQICLSEARGRFPDYTIEATEIFSLPYIEKDSVYIEQATTLSISKSEDSTTLKLSDDEIDSQLNDMILASELYLISNQNSVCLDCLSDISDIYNIAFEISNFDEEIISIIVSSKKTDSYPRSFNFLEVRESSLDQTNEVIFIPSTEDESQIKDTPNPPNEL